MSVAAQLLATPVEAPDGGLISDLETAEAYLESVTLEIKDIESQLGDPIRKGADGEQLSHDDFLVWRSRAKRALLYKQKFAMRLRQYVRVLRAHQQRQRVYLEQAYSALRRVQSGLVVSDDELRRLTMEIADFLAEAA